MPSSTIARLEQVERFALALNYLRKTVIVRASQNHRNNGEARNYRGRVEAVAMGQEGSQDVLVLVLDGPGCEALPMCAFDLSKVITITELADA